MGKQYTKQELIAKGYKYIATQNNEAKIEIWAKFTGDGDTVEYIHYVPNWKRTGRRDTISFTMLEALAHMRDKLREEALRKGIEIPERMTWGDTEKNIDYV